MSVEYTIRTQSNFAYMYGLGEVVSPGVVLFRDGNYDLSPEELEQAIHKAKAFKMEPKQ